MARGSWCAWVREILTPLDKDRLLYEWDSPLVARDIAQLHETTYWQSQLSPPPVGVASLYPHYASLKTVIGHEEHLKHPVRAVAAAVSQALIGHGKCKWRICTGARENLPRELRLCLHCDLRVVESVTRSLCACPLNNDLRTDMVTKLHACISVGLQFTLALPEENPDLWTQVLLQGHPEDLGVDFQMSLRALSAVPLMRISAKVHLFRPCGSLRLKQSNSSRA